MSSAPAPESPDLVPLSKLPHFDARTMPVAAIDSHLPPIAPEQLAPQAIRARFLAPPLWEPESRIEPRFTDRQVAVASVLVPIVLREQPTVLLTERTTHLSTHSGQIAFPGGKRDDTDIDAVDTALREAHEEIGLERRFVEVVGQLPSFTTGTRFVITPVIGFVDPAARLSLNAHEVADAFEVPLQFLMTPAYHRHHALEFDGVRREWLSMPYMDGSTERFIWGATAAMLRNLYRFLAA
ncbi:CoA pyrophosphatase [Ramlibacter sp. MMS24-I3-19]|uniref:CoA pyrophosphatase n=1 Tax=Ramlibacter sp. MMS24-I3-19 TaxID=3416606 RepID=UPI003D091775